MILHHLIAQSQTLNQQKRIHFTPSPNIVSYDTLHINVQISNTFRSLLLTTQCTKIGINNRYLIWLFRREITCFLLHIQYLNFGSSSIRRRRRRRRPLYIRQTEKATSLKKQLISFDINLEQLRNQVQSQLSKSASLRLRVFRSESIRLLKIVY